MGGFRFLHFATHGWFDPEDPRNSGLRLATGGETAESDLLSMDDILALPLSAEVVVLSACGSGLGELVRGEGFIGLTRAFLYAGSRSVVATLWDVEDRPTSEFMTEFYRFLRAGESASSALRRARLGFLASDRAGRRRLAQWAPFVLVGDPGQAPPRGSNLRSNGATE
jgi:CHAT domain-containing protein